VNESVGCGRCGPKGRHDLADAGPHRSPGVALCPARGTIPAWPIRMVGPAQVGGGLGGSAQHPAASAGCRCTMCRHCGVAIHHDARFPGVPSGAAAAEAVPWCRGPVGRSRTPSMAGDSAGRPDLDCGRERVTGTSEGSSMNPLAGQHVVVPGYRKSQVNQLKRFLPGTSAWTAEGFVRHVQRDVDPTTTWPSRWYAGPSRWRRCSSHAPPTTVGPHAEQGRLLPPAWRQALQLITQRSLLAFGLAGGGRPPWWPGASSQTEDLIRSQACLAMKSS
jgi:hypothetical protein